ncbi:hypothetical protein OEZ86_014016 [Tetradesmus obliquus]|nr:hypothetical protein OEZ86_014016 [Tetradesmus obliquus]
MAGKVTPTQAQLLAKGPYMPGVACTCGAAPDGDDYDDLPVRLRVRGSSSARLYAKKSFALRTLDQSANLSTAEDNKVSLLGFPREHNWVLHGPENDRTLGMRNWLAYGIGRRMGRYASRKRYFELFLNTEPGSPLSASHYWGVYMLQEPVSRDKHRVPISKYDPAVDPSGAYHSAAAATPQPLGERRSSRVAASKYDPAVDPSVQCGSRPAEPNSWPGEDAVSKYDPAVDPTSAYHSAAAAIPQFLGEGRSSRMAASSYDPAVDPSAQQQQPRSPAAAPQPLGEGRSSRVAIAKYDSAVDPQVRMQCIHEYYAIVSSSSPADGAGGFMFSYENDNIDIGSDPVLLLRLSQLAMVVDYPNNADQQTLAWLSRWMNDFEATLLQRGTTNMSNLLDVPAAVDYFLATEVTKNPDGYRGSIKMHKDRGGPLVIGPLWDYNEAFGMCCGFPIEGFQQQGASNGSSGGSAISAAGWRFNVCQDRGRCKVDPLDGISQWYRRLWQVQGGPTGRHQPVVQEAVAGEAGMWYRGLWFVS